MRWTLTRTVATQAPVSMLVFGLSIGLGPAAGSPNGTTEDGAPCHMSRQIFDRLETGMSLEAVAGVVGCTGDHAGSYDVGGEHTDIFNWEEDDSAYASAVFKNGILAFKRQRGLR